MSAMSGSAVCYREYPPCEALRGTVRAWFSFSELVETERGTHWTNWRTVSSRWMTLGVWKHVNRRMS